MSGANTNVELESIETVGGVVVSNPKDKKTVIPPKAEVKMKSLGVEEELTIDLQGEWPPKEQSQGKTVRESDDGEQK